MSNIRVFIAVMIVVTGAIGYAVEEFQGPYNIFTIPTKNENHQYMLNIMYKEFRRNEIRLLIVHDRAILQVLRFGHHNIARQMRATARRQALEFQERCRQQAREALVLWGYTI